MRLIDFLSDSKMSNAQFGKRVGVSQAAVNRYANGFRIPRPEIIARIEQETEGRVTAADHYEAYNAKALSAA